jgi:hypothetical protein
VVTRGRRSRGQPDDPPPNLTHSLRSASAAVDAVPGRLTCGVPYDVVPEIAGIVTGQVLRDDHVRTWLLTCGVLAWGSVSGALVITKTTGRQSMCGPPMAATLQAIAALMLGKAVAERSPDRALWADAERR